MLRNLADALKFPLICRCRHITSHYGRSEITKLPSILCLQEEIAGAIKDILAGIKVQERGVFVQASTIGSLEALLEFLRTSKINVRWHIAVHPIDRFIMYSCPLRFF